MKHATGMETCTKIYFFYLQSSINKNSLNLAIFTLQFDDVTIKTICYWANLRAQQRNIPRRAIHD